jgi:hypothetical protein
MRWLDAVTPLEGLLEEYRLPYGVRELDEICLLAQIGSLMIWIMDAVQ